MATPKTKVTLGTKPTAAQLSALQAAVGGNSATPFGTSDLSAVTNAPQITRANPTVGTPGPWDPYRQQLAAQLPADIPQSFIDEEVDHLNAQSAASGDPLNTPTPNDPRLLQYYAEQTKRDWAAKQTSAQGRADQQRYVSADQQRVSDTNNTSTTNAAAGVIAGIPAQETSDINKFYNTYVTPALKGQQEAVSGQASADRTAEGKIQGLTNDYATTVKGNQAARMADIGSTNAYDTGITNVLGGEALKTNAANSALTSTYTGQLQAANTQQSALYNTLAGQNTAANANQTGLLKTLSGQAGAVNANQTGLFNTLSGQASAANAQQSAGNAQFQGQISGLNSQEQAYLSSFTQQLNSLNSADRANYMNYLQETNPQMAELIAQHSDAGLVGNQTDVLNRYKDLSTPQVTAQERLIASLARQKFESDDKSNRDALMQQLAGRGLKSGGLVIAGQQASQQQLSNDRMNAELGLQANAVSRGMEGLAGYGNEANVLRNADDAMKQFQDQYKQNEAQRVSQLALQRNQSGYQETAAETGRANDQWNADRNTVNDTFVRDQAGYNANTETVSNNYGRDQSVFDAGTATNNNNYARDQSVFDAGTTTNRDNSTRDQSTYNAGTQTVNDNTTRNTSAFAAGTGTNTDNYNRINDFVRGPNGAISVNDNNSARYQTGLTTGDTTAGNVLSTGVGAASVPIANRAAEVGSASSAANTAGSAGQSFASVRQGVSSDQIDALQKALAARGLNSALQLAAKQQV